MGETAVKHLVQLCAEEVLKVRKTNRKVQLISEIQETAGDTLAIAKNQNYKIGQIICLNITKTKKKYEKCPFLFCC